jgi:hypothetical protein
MGSRPFPSRFAPTTWRGLRAQEHPDRADAFQQLIGDGLKAVYGTRAHVMPTAGGDGSIDAWFEPTATEPSHVFELPLPAIVERKDHDDALPHFVRNMKQGWARVTGQARGASRSRLARFVQSLEGRKELPLLR